MYKELKKEAIHYDTPKNILKHIDSIQVQVNNICF